MPRKPFQYNESEQEVLNVLETRWKKGRATYGAGMNAELHGDNPIPWIDEAIEEAADQFQYLVMLRHVMKKRIESESVKLNNRNGAKQFTKMVFLVQNGDTIKSKKGIYFYSLGEQHQHHVINEMDIINPSSMEIRVKKQSEVADDGKEK